MTLPAVWYAVKVRGEDRYLPALTNRSTVRPAGRRPTTEKPPRLFPSPREARRTITAWQKFTTYDLEIVPVVVLGMVDYNMLSGECLEAERARPLGKYAWPPEKWRKYRLKRAKNMKGTGTRNARK